MSLLTRFFDRRFVLIVLVISVVLRVSLALQGGQYFFSDEGRFDRGFTLYDALRRADSAAVRQVLAAPEHALFVWIGAGTAATQHLLAQFTPYGDWSNGIAVMLTIKFGAAVLSLFSALNLFLVYRLVKATGGGEREAGWALILMAAANTNFYFARHLLPYDAAITAGLCSLLVGVRQSGKYQAVICGFLAGVTYHVYNGYWYLVPVIGLTYYLAHRASDRLVLRTGLWSLGASLGLGFPIAVGVAIDGTHYLASMRAFSLTATQGMFSEGWSLPWEYLWHSEGIVGLVAVAATVGGFAWVRRARESAPARVRVALFGLSVAYFLLVLFSVGLTQFVVYARTVKPWVPFFALLGGWGIHTLMALRPRLTPFVAAGIGLAALVNFSPHFTRIFPREAEIMVLKNWGIPKHSLSVAGSVFVPLAGPLTRPDLVLVNAQLLYPIREEISLPSGEMIFRISHALSYPPFQYEGHTLRERIFIRSHDISIRLIHLSSPDQVPRDLPNSFRFSDRDRSDGH